ncbi:SDR family NAD(P)-dependent oxidoreductase [Actinosynnema mirum]|uniref:SDR family NAD(P)-dependent oxidoreductase n=1 Tax=Actinosynnema mirum TaxID=40567 RepID=UPI00019AB216|nr:SDR family NAD(P)-dependent oxidoreductase [Actinosynnema mirum]
MTGDAGGYPCGVDRPGFWSADRPGAWSADQPGICSDRPGFWRADLLGVWLLDQPGALRRQPPGIWRVDQPGFWSSHRAGVRNALRTAVRAVIRSSTRAAVRGVDPHGEPGRPGPPPGGGGEGDVDLSERPVGDPCGVDRPGVDRPGDRSVDGSGAGEPGGQAARPDPARRADRTGARNPGWSPGRPSPRGVERPGAWGAEQGDADDPVADRVVVITGASSGLGAAAARRFHALGARVVPVGRSPERTAALAAELGVTGHVVDFSSLATVRALADDLLAKLSRIDVLAANAGGIPDRTGPTVDRVDPVLQVNALGPWLLNALLLPALSGGRIVATSSRAHRSASLAVSEVDGLPVGARPLGAYADYGRAKLVSGILLRELGRRNPGLPVADFHPGVMATGFARHLGASGALFTLLARPLLVRPETAADQLVRIAARARATGYHVGDRPAPGSPQLDDPVLGALVWDMAVKATGHR